MRIVNAGQENTLSITNHWFALVEKHADAHGFHRGGHTDAVVVTKHPVYRPFQLGPQFVDNFETFFEWTICPAAIVAGQDANVVLKASDHANQMPHRAQAYVRVQIAGVKDGEIVKCRRKIGESHAMFFDNDVVSVSTRTTIKSSQLERSSDNPRC